MSLNKQEIKTISLGALVVAVALVYKLVTGLTGGAATAAMADRASLAGARQRIEAYDRARHSVRVLAADLGVEIPHVSEAEQETLIRQDIASRAQRSGLQLASLRNVETSSRRSSAAVRPVQFRLELTGPYDSLVGYIYQLEHAPIAYVVSDVSLEAMSSGSRSRSSQGGQPPQASGMVRATVKLLSYKFPKVLPGPKPAGGEPARQPFAAGGPPPGALPPTTTDTSTTTGTAASVAPAEETPAPTPDRGAVRKFRRRTPRSGEALDSTGAAERPARRGRLRNLNPDAATAPASDGPNRTARKRKTATRNRTGAATEAQQ